jgi:hypothetical protein
MRAVRSNRRRLAIDGERNSKAGGRGGKRPTEAFYRRSAGRKNSDPVPYSSSAGGQAEGGRISASSI